MSEFSPHSRDVTVHTASSAPGQAQKAQAMDVPYDKWTADQRVPGPLTTLDTKSINDNNEVESMYDVQSPALTDDQEDTGKLERKTFYQ